MVARKHTFSGTCVAACLTLLVAFPASGATGTAYAAVAANFSHPMQVLAARFNKATGFRIRTSTASTGTLYAQIRHGAPYDLFLAADAARPRRLERADLTVPDSRFTYAIGELVLWQPNGHEVSAQTLRNPGRIAIASPGSAPYGAATKQVLLHLKLWRGLRGRLVTGESITQAWQFVASGNAACGFVARSQVADAPPTSIWRVPQKLYAPLTQQAVLLKRGRNNRAARAFLKFLKTTARPLIASFGYRLPR